MTIYNLVLFVHILGALGLFAAIALSHLALVQLRRAQSVRELREWTGIVREETRLFPVSNAALLLAGLYLTITQWGWGKGWIEISLALFLAMGVLGPAVSGRRLGALGQAAGTAQDGAVSAALSAQINDPVLRTTANVTMWAGLGIVFLMTVKPGWGGSLAAIAVALAIGLILPLLSRDRG